MHPRSNKWIIYGCIINTKVIMKHILRIYIYYITFISFVSVLFDKYIVLPSNRMKVQGSCY